MVLPSRPAAVWRQCSWTGLCLTSKKLNFYSPSISLQLLYTHRRRPVSRYLQYLFITPLSIALPVPICLRRTNYNTSRPGFHQSPPLPLFPPLSLSHPLLHIHFNPINTFFPATLSLRRVFSPLPRKNPIHQPALPPHSSLCRHHATFPSLFLSLSLGTIKVSAVPRRVMESLPTPSVEKLGGRYDGREQNMRWKRRQRAN